MVGEGWVGVGEGWVQGGCGVVVGGGSGMNEVVVVGGWMVLGEV